MFSSNDLIQLVFANENDTYYSDSLLKLNLDQYLWFELHKQYNTVYFISPDNGGSIKTFGDISRKSFEEAADGSGFKNWLFGKSSNDALGLWILKQLNLSQNESAAFVCSLIDFCEIFKDQSHKDELRKMASSSKRTGVIVLTVPANIEKSLRLFLESPVFDYLNETAITDLREGDLRDMFAAIFKAKCNSCYFTNEFTKEAAIGILTNIVIDDMSTCPSKGELCDAADYLVQYVNNAELHRIDKVLKTSRPDMPRREIYSQLKNDSIRKKLFEKSKLMHISGNICSYLEKIGCKMVDTDRADIHIYRDPNSCAGKCIAHRPPKNADAALTRGESISSILNEIVKEAGSPKNRLENSKLCDVTKKFLNDAELAAETGDLETYRRAIYAVRVCMQWLYVAPDTPDESGILSIAEKLRDLITRSSNCHALKRDLELGKFQMGSDGKFSSHVIQQSRQKLFANEKLLNQYEDVVHASIIELSAQRHSVGGVADLANKLSSEFDKIKEEAVNPVKLDDDEKHVLKYDDDEEFVIEEVDYLYNPY